MIAYWSANFFSRAVVAFMSMLNYWIYGLVHVFCGIFMKISETNIFSGSMIEEFSRRMYVILGIYMLFKLVFSLFSAIVNPDVLLDKEKGMGKIASRTIIALAMLVLVPTLIFPKALEWQSKIAYTVPRIILGVNQIKSEETQQYGENIAATAIKTFYATNEACSTPNVDVDTAKKEATSLSAAIDLSSQLCEEIDKGEFRYEFNFIISLIAGIIMVILLSSYCIDIAIRGIKLGILQILAPIPIISYIDPKSEKNGSFGNWLKECGSTYIELFVKLAILYFVIYILGEFANGQIAQAEPYVTLFIIIGAFFFMGKGAAFICNILGIKKPESTGGFMKGLASIGAAVGIGAAGISGALTNYRGTLESQKARGVKQNRGKAFASAILGGGIGLTTAGKAVAGAKNGKMGAALSAVHKRNAAYSTAAASGATLFGKAGAYAQRAFTGETTAERLEREVSQYDTNAKNIDAIVSRADDKAKNNKHTVGFSSYVENGRAISVAGNYQAWTHVFSAAKNQGLSSFSFNGTTYTMEQAEKLDYGLMTSNSESYIKNRGFGDDKGFEDLIADYEQNNPGKTINATTTRGGLKDELDDVNRMKSDRNRELRIAKANSDATQPK